MADVFEHASRVKLRFESSRGCLSSEEVWDLSLPSLDALAKAVNKRLREAEEESFIPTPHQPCMVSHDTLRMELLKQVIGVKVVEREAARKKAEDRAKLARLNELLAAKEDDVFRAMSREEILKQIVELEAVV
mgnify:CR=1 FL=1